MMMKTSAWTLWLLCGSLSVLNAQNPSSMPNFSKALYEAEWRQIDSLENEGLPQSALELVRPLHQRAIRENNPAQVIKTITYLAKFESQLGEEDNSVRIMQQLRTEEKTATFPVNLVLRSMLGEFYFSYLQSRYWSFRDRTELAEETDEDPGTWTIGKLIKESTRYYQASLQDDRLSQLEIGLFDAITVGGEGSADLRPTLYDFLAHRAVEHFTNEQTYLRAPAYRFYLDQAAYFSPAKEFVRLRLENRDTASFHLQALSLLQDLIRRHLADPDPKAMLDADLIRLGFVYRNSVLPEKDELYRQALELIIKTYEKHPSSAEACHHLAGWYNEKAGAYEAGVESPVRWYRKEAVKWCEEGIRRFPGSYGANACALLISDIKRDEFELQVEEHSISGQPVLAAITYRNVPHLWFRVVKTPDNETINKVEYEQLQAFYAGLPALKEWRQNFTNPGDFQFHKTEIAIPALTSGKYLLLTANNADFASKSTRVARIPFGISNLNAFYDGNYTGGRERFLVVSRKTGEPESRVKAEFFSIQYNRGTGAQEDIKLKEAYTDANGLVEVEVGQEVSYRVLFTKGAESFETNRTFYHYGIPENTEMTQEEFTHFFLDRQIYRPGQTVYFKGVLLKKNKEGLPSILAGRRVKVFLQDVNGQEVASLDLKSNEYGTISGTFQAPSAGLLGQMSLRSDIGESYHGFQVEEYKRPKFEVKLNPVEKAYALDQEVIMTGQAKAYAGSNIDGAVVRYRVVREVRFPWAPWWKYPGYTGESMEISRGETITGKEGGFEFRFTALPDRTVARDQKPAFHFTAYVEVVDITGETHTAEGSVQLGYLGLVATVESPETWDKALPLSMGIKVTNLDDRKQPAKGKLSIHRLKGPGHPFVTRNWATPDMPVLSQPEFAAAFPLMPYQNEHEPHNWPRLEQVFAADIDTGAADSLTLNASGWAAGHYWIRFSTTDPTGEEIVVEQKITLYGLNTGELPPDLLFAPMSLKEVYEPGEQIQLAFGRPQVVPVHLFYIIDRDPGRRLEKWIRLDTENSALYTVAEEDRGGIQVNTLVQWQNRVFNDIRYIQIPWSNKKLTITFETFRDKLLPGQEEEWRLRISGPDKEKVSAELVAAMYDASLDAFQSNNWSFDHYPGRYSFVNWDHLSGSVNYFDWINYPVAPPFDLPLRNYRSLNWFDVSPGYGYYPQRMYLRAMAADMETSAGVPPPPPPVPGDMAAYKVMADSNMAAFGEEDIETGEGSFPVRKNLNETVFFYPQLTTDANGDILIRFKMNEALTRWKFLAFSHTKDLKFGLAERTVVTQKDLMVLPNPPRFLREGDRIEWTAKVSNLSDKPLAGAARLEILDALSMQPLSAKFGLTKPEVSFSTEAGQSAPLAWTLTIPNGLTSAVLYRVTAQSGAFADGEEAPMPVLTNRMLVTESLPLPIRGKQTKTFTLQGLKENRSMTLQHHGLTLEFTSNPAWYAVQALPYLMDYPHECSEQIFNRFYANALATSVVNQHPSIKDIFEKWKSEGGLQNPLSMNQEIKNILLTETPWLRNAQSEEEQQKNIALLFDLARMAQEQQATLAKLVERQSPNGGFSWFPGGRDSWYITQYMVEGLGHLKALGVLRAEETTQADFIAEKAIGFIDGELIKHYKELEKLVQKGEAKWEDDHLNQLAVHYLYARSFFEYPLTEELEMITGYYLDQAGRFWNKRGLYEQALLALSLDRRHKTQDAQSIVRSLRERALNNPELGMYWKYDTGWFWYELPIETHSTLIEVFAEVAKDEKAVDDLKVWLLKNKQTNHWATTKATAAAVYALLSYGDNWLLPVKPLKIQFPDQKSKAIAGQIAKAQSQAKAGTGYFKTGWKAEAVSPSLASVKVKNPNKTVAWGALFWQYFEDLDKIKTFRETPLSLKKTLYVEKPGDKGPVLVAIKSADDLHPGDKLKVRLELRVDRDMEYVHLKDMRASGLEPIETLSRYKWQGGMGYYESPGDAATNFFFDYLRKGTYIFEYPLRVVHRGDFSNGISSIQCMYAPEFSSHSAGERVKVN